MGKHSRRSANRVVRNTATATVVAAGATMVMVNPAIAAEINIPNVGSFQVPDEALQALPQVPAGSSDTHMPDQASLPANAIASQLNQNPMGQRIVDIARSKIGSPYAWGASGPNSFDCSGFTSWVYAQVGKHIPRTSQAQAGAGQRVSLDQLQPGDIIAYYGGASHVGIYVGNGTIVDALQSGTPVGERPLHYMPIHSAVRF